MRSVGAGLATHLDTTTAEPWIRHLVTLTPKPELSYYRQITLVGAGTIGAVPSIPADIADDDVLVLVADGLGATPTGWTELIAGTVYWRRVAGSVTAPNLGTKCGQIAAFRGCKASGSPVAAGSALVTEAGGAPATASSITPTTPYAAVMFALTATATVGGGGAAVAIGDPVAGPALSRAMASTITDPADADSVKGIGLWFGVQPAPGATGTETSSVTMVGGASTSVVLFALAPAVGWHDPSPTVYRWTDYHDNLTVSGYTFLAGGMGTTNPIPHFLGGRKEVAGLEIGSASLELVCGETAMLGSVTIPVAAARRQLDGATVLIERIYMPSAGDVSLGAMHLFQGYVGEVRVSGTSVELEVESGIALLNVQLPKRVFQSACTHLLYDAGCGLSRDTFTVSGTVSSGATTTSVPTSRTEATGTAAASRAEVGWFGLGVILFTSGACFGERRAIRSYSNTGGTFVLDRPLPAAPSNGDTFIAYPGCPRTLDACKNNDASAGPQFNNRARHGGFPFIPKNEAAL